METGLKDSSGKMICVGDLVKKEVTINKEVHGEWSYYRVEAKGMIVRLSYEKSEKGEIVPKGYMCSLLEDEYDHKDLCLFHDVSKLRPEGKLYVEAAP